MPEKNKEISSSEKEETNFLNIDKTAKMLGTIGDTIYLYNPDQVQEGGLHMKDGSLEMSQNEKFHDLRISEHIRAVGGYMELLCPEGRLVDPKNHAQGGELIKAFTPLPNLKDRAIDGTFFEKGKQISGLLKSNMTGEEWHRTSKHLVMLAYMHDYEKFLTPKTNRTIKGENGRLVKDGKFNNIAYGIVPDSTDIRREPSAREEEERTFDLIAWLKMNKSIGKENADFLQNIYEQYLPLSKYIKGMSNQKPTNEKLTSSGLGLMLLVVDELGKKVLEEGKGVGDRGGRISELLDNFISNYNAENKG